MLDRKDGMWYWGVTAFDMDDVEGLVAALKTGMYQVGPEQVKEIIKHRQDVMNIHYLAALTQYKQETEGK